MSGWILSPGREAGDIRAGMYGREEKLEDLGRWCGVHSKVRGSALSVVPCLDIPLRFGLRGPSVPCVVNLVSSGNVLFFVGLDTRDSALTQ